MFDYWSKSGVTSCRIRSSRQPGRIPNIVPVINMTANNAPLYRFIDSFPVFLSRLLTANGHNPMTRLKFARDDCRFWLLDSIGNSQDIPSCAFSQRFQRKPNPAEKKSSPESGETANGITFETGKVISHDSSDR